jgi:hypothetical protein
VGIATLAGHDHIVFMSFGLPLARLCESGTLLQLCLRVYQSPECEHHLASGARKRRGFAVISISQQIPSSVLVAAGGYYSGALAVSGG